MFVMTAAQHGRQILKDLATSCMILTIFSLGILGSLDFANGCLDSTDVCVLVVVRHACFRGCTALQLHNNGLPLCITLTTLIVISKVLAFATRLECRASPAITS